VAGRTTGHIFPCGYIFFLPIRTRAVSPLLRKRCSAHTVQTGTLGRRFVSSICQVATLC